MTQLNELSLGSGSHPARTETGATLNPVIAWRIQPAAIVAANVAAAQVGAAGAPLALATVTGNNVTVVTLPDGLSYIDLGCQRAITLTGVAGTAAANYVIRGKAEIISGNGATVPAEAVSETLTGPVGATTVTSTKTYRYIRSITPSAGTTNTVAAATADVFAFPYRIDSYGAVDVNWNGVFQSANTGFTAADATTPATAATGETRGKYAVPSASDGTKMLECQLNLYNVNSRVSTYGVVPFAG